MQDTAATRPDQAADYQGSAQPSFAPQSTEASAQLPHGQSAADMPFITSSNYESRGEVKYSSSPSFIDARSRHPVGSFKSVPEVTNVIAPSQGTAGSTVVLHIRTKFDLQTDLEPHNFSFIFGQKQCQAELRKHSEDNVWFHYTLSAKVPSFPETKHFDPKMTIMLRMQTANYPPFQEIEAGEFQFVDMHPDLVYQTSQDLGKKRRYSDEFSEGDEYAENAAKRQNTMRPIAKPRSLSAAYSTAPFSPPRGQTSLSPEYDYSYNLSKQSNYAATLSNNKALYAVPSGLTVAQANSRPARMPLGLPGMPAHLQHAFAQRSPGAMAATPARPYVSALDPAAPVLVRATTLAQAAGGPAGPSFNPYLYPSKAVIKIEGDLDSMADNWTREEFEAKRRLVVFERSQSGSTITTKFAPVKPEARPQRSICVSCILWEEKGECYITSVDTIHLLEQLVNVRFTVEEKNRIRRNLEGFRPKTVSKAKADSEEFFKVIMGFPNPKPRNIEKDVKVFPWKVLALALRKIINKYTASYSSTAGSLAGPPPYLPIDMAQSNMRQNTSPQSIATSLHSNAYVPGMTSSTLSPDMKPSPGMEGSAGHGMSVGQRDLAGQGMSSWSNPHAQYTGLPSAGRGSWSDYEYLENSDASTNLPSAAQSMHMHRSHVTPNISQMAPSGPPYAQYGQATTRI